MWFHKPLILYVDSWTINTERGIINHNGSSWSWPHGSLIYNYLRNQCLSPLMLWVRISIRARCTILCYEVCQWRETVRWFPPDPPVPSINKTDRHDIAELLLIVALNTKPPPLLFDTIFSNQFHQFINYYWFPLGILVS